MSCFNCGWHGTPVSFIQEVTGMTYTEINIESRDFDILPEDLAKPDEVLPGTPANIDTLPRDSINLLDRNQQSYWSHSDPVKKAIDTITNRKLDIAINAPKTLWISLTDYTHKNRLILPFYDEDNKIIFYQTIIKPAFQLILIHLGFKADEYDLLPAVPIVFCPIMSNGFFNSSGVRPFIFWY